MFVGVEESYWSQVKESVEDSCRGLRPNEPQSVSSSDGSGSGRRGFFVKSSDGLGDNVYRSGTRA